MKGIFFLFLIMILSINLINTQQTVIIPYEIDFVGDVGCNCTKGDCTAQCFDEETKIDNYIDFTQFPPQTWNITRFQITTLGLEKTWGGKIRITFGYLGEMNLVKLITALDGNGNCGCNNSCPTVFYRDISQSNYQYFPYQVNSTMQIHITNPEKKEFCLSSISFKIQLDLIDTPITVSPDTVSPTSIPTTIPTVSPTTTVTPSVTPTSSNSTSTPVPSVSPTISPEMKKISKITVIVCSIVIAIASVLGLLYCWKMKIEKLVEESTYSSITNTRNLSRIGDTPNDSVVFDDEDLVIEETIGKGSFGNVYRATWTGTEVAVKSLHVKQNSEEKQDFIREVSLLSALRHPNIVQFLGTHTKNDGELYMIFEFMPKGSLFEIIHDHSIDLQWKRIKDICMDATKGMIYLHSCNPIVIHRDLKSHNLLVDDYWRVKVCDFGLSRLAPQNSVTMTACGTPAWSSPELLKGEKYDEKIDVYSYAIICWELVMREIPYKGLDTFQIIYQVGTKNIRTRLPEDHNLLQKKRGIPNAFMTLITDCWDSDPSNRPSFKEIYDILKKM